MTSALLLVLSFPPACFGCSFRPSRVLLWQTYIRCHPHCQPPCGHILASGERRRPRRQYCLLVTAHPLCVRGSCLASCLYPWWVMSSFTSAALCHGNHGSEWGNAPSWLHCDGNCSPPYDPGTVLRHGCHCEWSKIHTYIRTRTYSVWLTYVYIICTIVCNIYTLRSIYIILYYKMWLTYISIYRYTYIYIDVNSAHWPLLQLSDKTIMNCKHTDA